MRASTRFRRQNRSIAKLIDMSDEEAERRAAADPDAGVVPPGFWDSGDGAPAAEQAADHVAS